MDHPHITFSTENQSLTVQETDEGVIISTKDIQGMAISSAGTLNTLAFYLAEIVGRMRNKEKETTK